MTRIILLVTFFLLISAEGSGQCVNPPTVTLSSNSGTSCGTTPVTVSGNIFGGGASKVTIKEDGGGTVSPTSATTSPFSFTYSPKNGDYGKTITVTVTTDKPAGTSCTAAKATYTLTVNANPSVPITGTITQPTCSLATGSVVLTGLPSIGTWTITRTPGEVISTGTGTNTTISGIPSGSYTFKVADSAGCVSTESANVIINAQPALPASPTQTVDCTLGYGKAVVTVTSPLGSSLQYRIDAGALQNSTSFTNVANGDHTVTVIDPSGCTTTGTGFQVSCGCANPPTVTLGSTSGNTCGTNPLTISDNTFGGSATSVTITENGSGIISPDTSSARPFYFTYTPSAGDVGNTIIITVTTNNPLGTPCVPATATFTLSVNASPSAPLVSTITQPTCKVATGSVVLSGLPATGTWTLTRLPGGVTNTGTGTNTTIADLPSGTYSFSVTNASGCTSVKSVDVVINAPFSVPLTPIIGTITQPTCIASTGNVLLNGLPSSGAWILIRMPGGITTPGSGTSTIISNLAKGVYTFTVTDSTGCISPSSAEVVILAQPSIPSAPAAGNITVPTCTLPTGSVILNGLPGTGTWTLTRYPGTIISTGTGTFTTINGLLPGTYNFTVTNAAGCLSSPSANVQIPAQPVTPTPPILGTISQPTCSVHSGSAVLAGLPAFGNWTLTRTPDGISVSGSSASTTISGLLPGTYTYTVTNSVGCTSQPSSDIVITMWPDIPALVVTNPAAICSPSKADLTSPAVTFGSTPGLTFTYWTNAGATIECPTPSTADAGIYYIKGTSLSGCSDIKPVIVTVYSLPSAKAGPDQVLEYLFETNLNAEPAGENETGVWSLISGTGEFFDSTYARTSVKGLSLNENKYLWTVKNGVCPASTDTVIITVHDLVIPTLITPNMDGKNDYFVIRGLNAKGKVELVIFDRRGVQVYKNVNYDNLWNGVDFKGDPLPDDTYFYVIQTENDKSLSGYVVIRR